MSTEIDDVDREIAGIFYSAYLSGLTVREIADRCEISVGTVYRRLRLAELPLIHGYAHRSAGQARTKADRQRIIEAANKRRVLAAAYRTATAAQEALSVTTYEPWRIVLQLRIDHPDASLRELGELADPPLTKHQVSSLLRNALSAAAIRTAP